MAKKTSTPKSPVLGAEAFFAAMGEPIEFGLIAARADFEAVLKDLCESRTTERIESDIHLRKAEAKDSEREITIYQLKDAPWTIVVLGYGAIDGDELSALDRYAAAWSKKFATAAVNFAHEDTSSATGYKVFEKGEEAESFEEEHDDKVEQKIDRVFRKLGLHLPPAETTRRGSMVTLKVHKDYDAEIARSAWICLETQSSREKKARALEAAAAALDENAFAALEKDGVPPGKILDAILDIWNWELRRSLDLDHVHLAKIRAAKGLTIEHFAAAALARLSGGVKPLKGDPDDPVNCSIQSEVDNLVHTALSFGHLQTIQKLWPFLTQEHRDALLRAAVRYERPAIVRWLVEAGVDPFKEWYSGSPLTLAKEKRETSDKPEAKEILKYLYSIPRPS